MAQPVGQVLRTQRPQRRLAALALLLVALLAAAAVGWSIRAVVTPVPDGLKELTTIEATVREGRIGSSLTLNATAKWTSRSISSNGASGVVTTVDVRQGRTVDAGDRLYSVDLRPVVVAAGKVPAFRSIGYGARGADVAQLQRFLQRLGDFSGPIDGVASSGTVDAIRSWQSSLGVASDGVVRNGDVLFVPELPQRIALDRSIVARGKTLAGGEPVLQGLGSPAFGIEMTAAQAAGVRQGDPVRITSPRGHRWRGVAGPQHFHPGTGNTTVAVLPAGDGDVCRRTCVELPVGTPSLLKARVVTVPARRGLVVPTAALMSSADGDISVTRSDGRSVKVEVVGSGGGLSLITGIAAGTKVRVPTAPGS